MIEVHPLSWLTVGLLPHDNSDLANLRTGSYSSWPWYTVYINYMYCIIGKILIIYLSVKNTVL